MHAIKTVIAVPQENERKKLFLRLLLREIVPCILRNGHNLSITVVRAGQDT